MKYKKTLQRFCNHSFKSLGLLLIPGLISAQTHFSNPEKAMVFSEIEKVVLSDENQEIVNQQALSDFFGKLKNLQTKNQSQVRIVHIGDSHIQAGFFTGKNREILQEKFGNAGLGFSFPHRLANSNGIQEVRYFSSIPWTGMRNIHSSELDSVGLSGFSLKTNTKDFALKLEVKDEKYYFNTLKPITPQSAKMLVPALSQQNVEFKNYSIEKKTHIIKSGEALSIIARKYGVSVAQIKQANGMKSNMIRAGAKLTIPVKSQKPAAIDRNGFQLMEFKQEDGRFTFHSEAPLSDIWFLSNSKFDKFSLNGFILENDHPGIIYSGIGVNGARFSDYLKTNLFFEQLLELQPDLLVISLGTNEAHDKLEVKKFKEKLMDFVQQIRKNQPDLPIVFTTPPPSFFKRQFPNTYSADYANAIKKWAMQENFAVWDLFEVLGGNNKVRENFSKGILSKDFVHYSEKGYNYSAELFTQSLLAAYQSYLQNQRN